MTDGTVAGLRRSPLHEAHVAAGGRLVPFAGWELPVLYDGVIAEHQAVRTEAGVFDVSHMGQIVVSGPSAVADLQRLLSNDLERLVNDGDAQYTLLTNERGGIEDDLIVYRRSADEYLLVVNAANTAHDLAWIQAGVDDATSVANESDSWAMIAVQGPRALELLAGSVVDLRDTPTFQLRETTFAGDRLLACTTGYTGERGCELLVPPQHAPALWKVLVERCGITPCGLGARDTLRLEACYPLHGNDIDAQTSAVAAGLGWACGWNTDFVGRGALEREREAGPNTRLQAVRMLERGIPRGGCSILAHSEVVGTVTSGTMSPTLGIGIALAYVQAGVEVGTEVLVDVRGKQYGARIERRPLYRPTN